MNLTETLSSALAGGMDRHVSGLLLSGLQYTLTTFRPELEILFCIAFYSPFLAQTFAYTSVKLTHARNYPYFLLISHIATGLLLVLRYHARFAGLRVWPKPEMADLTLFSVFNASSFLLEVYRSKSSNTTAIIRTAFQSSVLVHSCIFAASWMGHKDPALFRASVKFVNWFAWYRMGLRVLPKVDLRLAQMKNLGVKNEVTIIVSACLALWEAGVPDCIPIFMSLVSAFIVMERALARILASYSENNLLKRLVFASGYVDFNYLKEKSTQTCKPGARAVNANAELGLGSV